MTSTDTATVRKCKTCAGPVRYLSEREAPRIADAGWIHTRTGQRRAAGADSSLPQFDYHWAGPVPQCPACGSEEYVYTAGAWADEWDCKDCRHHVYHGLGD